jgi:hypothetical protein
MYRCCSNRDASFHPRDHVGDWTPRSGNCCAITIDAPNPGEVPVVRLRTGGYQHNDSRVGWVVTPVFVVFGKTSRDSAAKPDTSQAATLNDEIPHLT